MQSSTIRPRGTIAILGLALAVSSAGCATITGLATGVLTGGIDAPAEIYRHYPQEFHDHPSYWSFNIVVFVPVGIVLGPVVGFAKGIALDMEALIGETHYGPVFGSYGKRSIWRPYTFGWHQDAPPREPHGPSTP